MYQDPGQVAAALRVSIGLLLRRLRQVRSSWLRPGRVSWKAPVRLRERSW